MAKYTYGTEENRAFMNELGEDLLNFGHRFPSPGGSSYYLGDDGTPMPEMGRFTWITCRMCHVYSIGHFRGHAGSDELIDAALKGLRGELKDTVNGGWYRGLDVNGEPLSNKECYTNAFVILSACSAMRAGRDGAKELLDEALEVFDRYFWSEEDGLARDTWNTEFTWLDPYRGVNSNMHTVEAFLATADVTGRDIYRERCGRIIDHVIGWAGANNWRIPEHYDENWQPLLEFNADKKDDQFKPYGATNGHGIEWARLITQWALSTYGEGDKSEPYIEAACNLYDRAVEDGWYCDGAPGIVYTTDWEGKPVVHDRMHWTLAEAINSAALLYRVTGEQRYADDYAEFTEYLDECVVDHEKGSWFHQLDEHNNVIGTVWPGKSDIYHALQATILPYEKTDTSIICAVSQT